MTKYIKNPSVGKERKKETQHINNVIINKNTMKSKNKQKIKINNNQEINIIKAAKHINFINKFDSDDILLQIPIASLSDTFLKYGSIKSYWINQLLEMKWVTNDLLYQLGVSIQHYHPVNEINWFLEYYEIECEEYNWNKYQKKLHILERLSTQSRFIEVSKILTPDTPKKYKIKIFLILKDKFESHGLIPNMDI